MDKFSVSVIIWTVLSLSIHFGISHANACQTSDQCAAGSWCDIAASLCEKCNPLRCKEDECIRVCPDSPPSTTPALGNPQSPTQATSNAWVPDWLLLTLLVLVTVCLLVIAVGLTAFVIYRCVCTRGQNPDNADAEKPFLRQTSTSTRTSESTNASDDAAFSMTSQKAPLTRGDYDVMAQPRGSVTINNVMTVSANAGAGEAGQGCQLRGGIEGQRPVFYAQQEPPPIVYAGKALKA